MKPVKEYNAQGLLGEFKHWDRIYVSSGFTDMARLDELNDEILRRLRREDAATKWGNDYRGLFNSGGDLLWCMDNTETDGGTDCPACEGTGDSTSGHLDYFGPAPCHVCGGTGQKDNS